MSRDPVQQIWSLQFYKIISSDPLMCPILAFKIFHIASTKNKFMKLKNSLIGC